MRIALALALALALLTGAAAVLLSTNQAPLPLPLETSEVPPAPAAAPEVKAMSTEEFRILGAEVMRSLPPKGSPVPIFAAREGFQKLEEAIGEEAGLLEEAMTLFQSCARSEQYAESVRALCYLYLRGLAKRSGKDMPRPRIAPEIRQLADKLGS